MTAPHDTAPCPGFVTDLVLRCARGDETALGRLFDLFITLVLTEVGGGAPTVHTDALAVETFRRVWLQSRRYDPASQEVVGWVLEQARIVSGRQARPLAGLVAT